MNDDDVLLPELECEDCGSTENLSYDLDCLVCEDCADEYYYN